MKLGYSQHSIWLRLQVKPLHRTSSDPKARYLKNVARGEPNNSASLGFQVKHYKSSENQNSLLFIQSTNHATDIINLRESEHKFYKIEIKDKFRVLTNTRRPLYHLHLPPQSFDSTFIEQKLSFIVKYLQSSHFSHLMTLTKQVLDTSILFNLINCPTK